MLPSASLDDRIAFLRGRARQGRLVAVLGAGVSIDATGSPIASWRGLLEDGIERCRRVIPRLDPQWVERKKLDLDTPYLNELLHVAGLVVSYLNQRGSNECQEWLHASIGNLERTIRNKTAIEALDRLGIPIATTNYDGLVERVANRHSVVWKETPEVRKWMEGRSRGVLHIHGHYRSIDSIVLTPRQYEQILEDEAIRHKLQTIVSDNTILFVGCGAGLADPNFQALRGWMRRVLGSAEHDHVRLCLASQREELLDEHDTDEGILIHAYGDSYEKLAAFLDSLAGPDTEPSSGDSNP